MPPVDIAELVERLARAATPGEWTVVDYGEGRPALTIHSNAVDRICFMATAGSHGDEAKIAADAAYIAAASPATILALVEEMAALREREMALVREIEALRDDLHAADNRIADLLARAGEEK